MVERMNRTTRLGLDALVASVKISNEIVSIVELAQRPMMLSAINASITVPVLRERLKVIASFLDAVEAEQTREG